MTSSGDFYREHTHQTPGQLFVTKDSGVRSEYASGMVRDTQDGKPDYALLDRPFLKRWAELMTRGAKKYGRRNWQNANSEEELERFKSSAFRHLMQWLDGETDEDHAAAVCFNLAAAEHVKAKQTTTTAPDSLNRKEII
jgi:hypothetical protein